jgi:hypothetical protein
MAMKDPHNLIRTHQGQNPNRGRRWHEAALNRAVVVLTVAAWQAYVQDTTRGILTTIEPATGTAGVPLYRVVRAATKNLVRRFNTPDSRNTLDLFHSVGFDPEPQWSFDVGRPPETLNPQRVRERLEQWLDVRHTIAHAAPLPALAIVSGRTQRGPTLHRKDAEACIEFFECLVKATADEAAARFP